MNHVQNHCVPTWKGNDIDADNSIHQSPPPPPPQPPLSRTLPSHSMSTDTSMLDYKMAELTWVNGQLTMHGLGLPREPRTSNLADAVGWTDQTITRANGMLESIVNHVYDNNKPTTPPGCGGAFAQDDDIVPWYGPTTPAPGPVSLDALVPTNNVVGCSTRVGSCSAAAARVPIGSDWSVSASASESNRRKRQAEDTCEQLSKKNNNGITSTSVGAVSPENTKTFTVDDHDSVCHSRSQRERAEEEENQKQGRTKRNRAAAVHNQSERKRRDKINQRMKTLQKLVPNSNKTDKASMLDEVIEYLKQLQAQIQMLSRMSMPSMMMPLAIQQQLQMSMMAPMGMGMGIGMGMGMDHVNIAGVPPPFMNMVGGGECMLPQRAMPPPDPLSLYLACQSHPMTMDAYNKMAAVYQQLQQ